MEYYRTDDGQIQADLAKRLGIILKQYHEEITSPEKYEVSLCLSILQTLLTNCVELLNTLSRGERKNNPISLPQLSTWGIDEKNILFNSFNHVELTPEIIIRHIRNSLSHPTKIDIVSERPNTTGYTTKGKTDKIESVVFVTSPDVNPKGKIKTYDSKESVQTKMNQDNNFPPNVEILENSDSRFSYFLDGKPFYRIFKIELSPQNLLTLTYSLASYLSHPLDEKWNGRVFTIQKLAA